MLKGDEAGPQAQLPQAVQQAVHLRHKGKGGGGGCAKGEDSRQGVKAQDGCIPLAGP